MPSALRVQLQLRIVGDDDSVIRDEVSCISTRATTGSRRSACRWTTQGPARPAPAARRRRPGGEPMSPGIAAARSAAAPCAARGRYPIVFRTAVRQRAARQPALSSLPLPAGGQPDLQPAERAVHRAHRARSCSIWRPVGLADVLRRDRRSAQGCPADRCARPTPRPSAATCTRWRCPAEAELGQRAGLLHRRAARRAGQELPHPAGPIVVGIDGGYVRDCEDKKEPLRGRRRQVHARGS